MLAAASLAFSQADWAEAIRLGTQALDLLRQMDDQIYVVACLFIVGWSTLRAGDLVQAERYLDEAVEGAAFPALAYSAQQGLSHIYSHRGEFDRAEAALAEALEGARLLGNPRGVALSLAHQGALALQMGRYDQASRVLIDAIVQLEALGDVSGISIPLGLLARVQQKSGRLEEAAHLFGATEGLKERTGTGMVGSDLSAYQESLSLTRSALGAAFTPTFERAKQMDRTTLVSYLGSLVSTG